MRKKDDINKCGIDVNGLDKDGYNINGVDEDGLNKDGFNINSIKGTRKKYPNRKVIWIYNDMSFIMISMDSIKKD